MACSALTPITQMHPAGAEKVKPDPERQNSPSGGQLRCASGSVATRYGPRRLVPCSPLRGGGRDSVAAVSSPPSCQPQLRWARHARGAANWGWRTEPAHVLRRGRARPELRERCLNRFQVPPVDAQLARRLEDVRRGAARRRYHARYPRPPGTGRGRLQRRDGAVLDSENGRREERPRGLGPPWSASWDALRPLGRHSGAIPSSAQSLTVRVRGEQVNVGRQTPTRSGRSEVC